MAEEAADPEPGAEGASQKPKKKQRKAKRGETEVSEKVSERVEGENAGEGVPDGPSLEEDDSKVVSSKDERENSQEAEEAKGEDEA